MCFNGNIKGIFGKNKNTVNWNRGTGYIVIFISIITMSHLFFIEYLLFIILFIYLYSPII